MRPGWWGRGLSTRLLGWAQEQAGDADLLVTTETVSADDEYRPDLSLLARGPDGRAVGFVNVLGMWVNQVPAIMHLWSLTVPASPLP